MRLQSENIVYNIDVKNLIIIPAFNEQACILNTVREVKEKAPDFDCLVINDHSSDFTGYILEQNGIQHVNLPANLGIGGAVQTGYKYAFFNGYDTAVQLDADGQHDPSFLKSMLDKMIETDADMVIGSRFIEKQGFQSSFARRMGIRYFSGLIKFLTGKKITDPTSGLRLANRKVIEMFAEDYPVDYPEPESTAHILKKGMKVQEIPVIMRERQGGKSSINMKRSVYYMIKVSIAILLA